MAAIASARHIHSGHGPPYDILVSTRVFAVTSGTTLSAILGRRPLGAGRCADRMSQTYAPFWHMSFTLVVSLFAWNRECSGMSLNKVMGCGDIQ